LLLQVHKNPERRLVKVSLKDAVAAIKRTIRANIENLIPAAKILSGSRTRFEKLPGKRNHPKGFFIQMKCAGLVWRGFLIALDRTGAAKMF
jgi:hypothetical protein